jgi:Flp pilus assembly protein TadG
MHTRIRRIRNRLRSARLLRLRGFTRDESGLQLVELTIVIPIFLMLFAATAEFGRYFYEYTTLAKAARVGARYMSTAPATALEESNAQKIVVYGNINGTGSPILSGFGVGNVSVARQVGNQSTLVPETYTVAIINYKHQPIFDLGKLTKVAGLSMKIDVKPSVTMRYLLTQPPPI